MVEKSLFALHKRIRQQFVGHLGIIIIIIIIIPVTENHQNVCTNSSFLEIVNT